MNRPEFRTVIVLLALAQAACTAPDVDRDKPGFSELAYQAQLQECRLTTAAHYAWHGFVGALIGSGIGAAEGVGWGAVAGNAGEGAAIGAAVGAVVGLGVGAYDAVGKETASVEECVREKGYAITAG